MLAEVNSWLRDDLKLPNANVVEGNLGDWVFTLPVDAKTIFYSKGSGDLEEAERSPRVEAETSEAVYVFNTSGLSDLSLNVFKDIVSQAEYIKVNGITADTEIISGRNTNTYRVRGDAHFPGTLTLKNGPQYNSIAGFETSVPVGIEVEHGLNFAESLKADFLGVFDNFKNPTLIDLSNSTAGSLTYAGLKGLLPSLPDVGPIINAYFSARDNPGSVFSSVGTFLKESVTNTLSANFLDAGTFQVDGIAQIVLEPGVISTLSYSAPASITNVKFGSGLNMIKGDANFNTFASRPLGLGVHMMNGGRGGDTYKMANFWGLAAVLEVPDLTIGVGGTPVPVPEALDTLDFSGFVGNITVDVYDFNLLKDTFGTIEGIDLTTWPDISTNFLVVKGVDLLGNTAIGLGGFSADPSSLAGSSNMVAMDIESLVGPKFGNLRINMHTDANLRGTVVAGSLGTVTLDYSNFNAPVTVSAGKSSSDEIAKLLGLPEFSGGFLGDGLPKKVVDATIENDASLVDIVADFIPGIELPEKATGSATGISGHRFGGLTTFVDFFGPDNQVNKALANLAVAGLTKVIGSGPSHVDTLTNEVGASVEWTNVDSLDNITTEELDLWDISDNGEKYTVDLETGILNQNDGFLKSLENETILKIRSGQKNDILIGSSGDETFLFRPDENSGWGIDYVDIRVNFSPN